MKTKSTAHAKFAEKIKASWTKSVSCILETARLCAEANERLDAREKAALIADLPFDASAFSKLAKIGGDQRLDVDPVPSLLPPSYSIIYAISQLSNGQLEQAVSTGLIKPTLKRSEVESFKRHYDSRNDLRELFDEEWASESAEPQIRTFGTIQVTDDCPSDRLQEFEQELRFLANQFGATFAKRQTQQERSMAAYSKSVSRAFKKLARRRIREMKAARMAGTEHLSAAQRKKLWGYAKDECEIPENFTDDEVRSQLEFLGFDQEVGEIYRQARESVTVPEFGLPYAPEYGLPFGGSPHWPSVNVLKAELLSKLR